MRGVRWMVMGMALMAGAAFAQQPGTERPGMQQPGTERPGMQQPGTQQPGMQQPGMQQPGAQQMNELDPENWISELMLVNRWAIDLSQAVSNQAATPQVKRFSRETAQQHQQLQQKLQTLAERANVNVRDVDDALQGLQTRKEQFMHMALLTSLQGIPTLNGANVDRAYLSSMVLAYDLAIDKLQWAMKQTDNRKLDTATRDVLNTLMQNRTQAHRLLGQVAPKVQRGQARQPAPARP